MATTHKLTHPPVHFCHQSIPQISSLTWVTTVIPLVAVLALTAAKDAVDDIVSWRLTVRLSVCPAGRPADVQLVTAHVSLRFLSRFSRQFGSVAPSFQLWFSQLLATVLLTLRVCVCGFCTGGLASPTYLWTLTCGHSPVYLWALTCGHSPVYLWALTCLPVGIHLSHSTFQLSLY